MLGEFHTPRVTNEVEEKREEPPGPLFSISPLLSPPSASAGPKRGRREKIIVRPQGKAELGGDIANLVLYFLSLLWERKKMSWGEEGGQTWRFALLCQKGEKKAGSWAKISGEGGRP